VVCRERNDLIAQAEKERIIRDDQRTGALFDYRRERRVDVVRYGSLRNNNLLQDRGCCPRLKPPI
jgi:hypothetical protein